MFHWKKTAWLCSLLSLSCGGTHPSSTLTASPTEARPAPAEQPDPENKKNKDHRVDEGAGEKPGRAPSPEPTPVEMATPVGLLLPSNSAFLKSQLPEKLPGRYKNWRRQALIQVGVGYLHHTSFADSGRKILTQSQDDLGVRVYDRKTRRLLSTFEFPDQIDRAPPYLSWEPLPGNPIGGSAYFALAKSGGVDLHDLTTGEKLARLLEGSVRSLRLSQDKGVLISESLDETGRPTLSFFERDSALSVRPRGELALRERADAWDLSRDNRLVAAAYYPSDDLVVYDLHKGEELFHLMAPKYTSSVAFSPDGRWLAAGGKGLLLVDLLNHTRRAFFSHVYNNIDTVRFSPSGDALAASSYDGHIRLFAYDDAGPTLRLLTAFRHAGTANVYEIDFDEEGNSLVSGSGDQTVRVFGGGYRPTSRSPEHDSFRTLAEWRALVPEDQLVARAPVYQEDGQKHSLSSLLGDEPRPCRLREGTYACRVSSMYKMRDCTVRKTERGDTLLTFHEGNLLSLVGVAYDDGNLVRYDAWETSGDSVVACAGCERQPLHAVFRGTGNQLTGLLLFRPYHDPYSPTPEPTGNATFEEAEDRFLLTLQFQGAPTHPTPAPRRSSSETIDPRLLPIP